MAAIDSSNQTNSARPATGNASDEVFKSLISVALKAANAQLDKFCLRLVDALMQLSDGSSDSKEASLSFNSANLLKKNIYAYHFIVSGALQKALKREIEATESPFKATRTKSSEGLSLVPYADMDRKLLLNNLARPIEADNADQLTALRLRIASLLDRDEISNHQNPFRPDVFLSAITDSWNEFNPDSETHAMILPLLKQEVFLDLAPVYGALNSELVASGVLPELADFYNIKKTNGNTEPKKKKSEGLDPAALRQLRQLFGEQPNLPTPSSLPATNAAQAAFEALGGSGVPMIPGLPMPGAQMSDVPMIPGLPMPGMQMPGVPMIPGMPGAPISGAPMIPGAPGTQMSGAPMIPGMPGNQMISGAPAIPGMSNLSAYAGQVNAGGGNHGAQATMTSSQLLSFLSNMQNLQVAHQQNSVQSHPAPTPMLASIKAQAPQGAMNRVDESTIDLLTKIFDVVFRDQNIPAEIKGLISFLQVPVLKAALVDKEFFFKEEHPARRLIELLTKTSVGWDQSKGQDDPLYQTIKRNVNRVQMDFDQQATIFSDVVSDLENFLQQEEIKSAEALSEPIAQALKQEKIVQATKTAKSEVAMRIGTGEVVAFVETFLENKWVPVLTLAYSIQEEKPRAVESALKTMDDLIWSVKPKITMEERKELIAKLPSMLSILNKWLNLVKLDDTERLQFFAELAECHASIVRAPIEMSPQRRLEIAMEVAKEAAERRLQKLTEQEAAPEPVVDDFTNHVDNLERGMWLEFIQEDAPPKKVKLSWVSPLRSLYIFTTSDKAESFSLSAEDLVKTLREDRAHVIQLGGLIDRAINEALEDAGANDPDIHEQSAA